MAEYAYRIVNVFADPGAPGGRLTGNPLCVFEDGRGLDSAAMQALALQFNLSETVFVLPSDRAAARIRIFTPAFEMPFAGHPVLGSAHVVRALRNSGDSLTLETNVGVIPVSVRGGDWTLKANRPQTCVAEASSENIAAMLGIAPADIGGTPLWVNTGNEQLLVPLASPDAVRRCRPDGGRMLVYRNRDGAVKVYVWAALRENEILARFFFPKHGTVIEDFGTGSAAANLGGWFVAQQAALPLRRVIRQGEPILRPSRLQLDVDGGGNIFVTGHVLGLGRGVITL